MFRTRARGLLRRYRRSRQHHGLQRYSLEGCADQEHGVVLARLERVGGQVGQFGVGVGAAQGQTQLACSQRVIAADVAVGDAPADYSTVTCRHQVDRRQARRCMDNPDATLFCPEACMQVVVEDLYPEAKSVAVGSTITAEEVSKPAEEAVVGVLGVLEGLGNQQAHDGYGVVAV